LGLLLVAIATAGPSPAFADSDTRQAFSKLQQGRTALLRAQHRAAVQLLTEAILSADLPADARAFALGHRGLARTYLGELRTAIHDFNTAIELAPEDPTLYNNRGNALLEIGLYSEAAKDFDQAIALSPSYGAAYNNRGNALVLLLDHTEALADFSTAIDLMPLNAVPFNGRARVSLALGRPAGAIRDLSRAIELNSHYGQAYINRAEALIAIQRYQEAVGDYSSAISLGAGSAKIYRARASLYAALKMQRLALADLAEARKLEPATTDDAEAAALADEAILAAIAVPAVSRSASDPACAEKPTVLLDNPGVRTVADTAPKPPDATLLYRSASAQSVDRDDAAALAYRTAVNCASQSQADPEPLAQLASAEQHDAHALAAQVWRLERTGAGAYFVTHPEHPELHLRLEMYGAGDPELLHWQDIGGPKGGLGLLHYRAGTSPEGDELDYVAVIDTGRSRLLAIEPASWGDKHAVWTWGETELVVVDPQGIPSRVQLDGQLTRKLMLDGKDMRLPQGRQLSRKHGQVGKSPRPRVFTAGAPKPQRRARSYGSYAPPDSAYRQRVPSRFDPRTLRYPGYAYRP
jgi:tetratricopeptide (TPR) repeat protein